MSGALLLGSQEKLFKRAVIRSQSPHAFGSALSSDASDLHPSHTTRSRRLSFDETNNVQVSKEKTKKKKKKISHSN